MSKNEWKKLVGVAGRMLLAFVFVFSQTAWAGQDQKAKDKTGSAQKAAAQQTSEKQPPAATTTKVQNNQVQGEESESSVAEEKPNDVSHQGIKVHGHWTIEVRNPDGSLATRREFENSLFSGASGGSFALSSFLARQYIVGAWAVLLSGNGICAVSFGAGACNILEPSGSVYFSSSSNLTVTATNTGTVVLSGSVTTASAGQITSVNTAVLGCPPGSAYAPGCNVTAGYSVFSFTARSLDGLNGDPPAVSVSSGQLIAVTVTLSFS